MANHVCHFEIPADDIGALKGFYGGVFGWSFERMPGDMEYHLIKTTEASQCGTSGGDVCGGIMLRQDPHQGPTNYICVDSIDESLEKAHAAGATDIVGKSAVPKMGWFAVLLDPQKNPFGLWQDDANAS
ncbi:MAG: VOC family protein [Thermodesulfobacteriota bacterium]